jgi:hypothetical protein
MQWEFLRQLSSNEDNKVIGIVRDKKPTDKRVAEELGARSNITILQGDLTDYDSLKVCLKRTLLSGEQAQKCVSAKIHLTGDATHRPQRQQLRRLRAAVSII